MKSSLKNKVAIVTGGASGIGLAITDCLSRQGAKVHIVDLVEKEIESPQKIVHKCDISDANAVQSLFAEILEKEQLDILINNAGIASIGNIENTDVKDLDRLYEINIKGIFNCTRNVISHMKKRGGVIVNMASIAASVGIPDRFAYSMTKGAVLAMTYSIAKDYIGFGIRCNSISPARVHTPFVDGFLKKYYPDKEDEMLEKLAKTQPIGRMGTPEEIAHLALYLCSDEASFVTGTDFPIDGGYIKLNGQ